MNSLIDLANRIGFEAIDQEIESWIEMGEFDHMVVERAAVLQAMDTKDELKQAIHRANCPSGPYGWEYCSRCSVV